MYNMLDTDCTLFLFCVFVLAFFISAFHRCWQDCYWLLYSYLVLVFLFAGHAAEKGVFGVSDLKSLASVVGSFACTCLTYLCMPF